MKLYTEEQVDKMLSRARMHKQNDTEMFTNEYLLSEETPIELPSDEEIDRKSEVLYPINKGGSMWMPSRYDIDKANRQEGFLDCAKWMKEQILNQNK